jgi:two-component system, chemotaxis family, protein-glutamate methylesterase/glutaminase
MRARMIVMGASWGGLRALEVVLRAIPRDFAAPIVIAQHRAPDSATGALQQMLTHHSGHDVAEPSDKDPIEPGRVYIAPPDYHLIVEQDGFALSTEDAVHYSRPSIDVLFDTAADVYADALAAVILTGANDDGAYGIMRVRRRGGITIAQDPATAERGAMPAAAMATGAVQHVLPLEEIGPFLTRLAHDARDVA